MEWILGGIVVYLVIGVATSFWVHATNPIIYWDGSHAFRSFVFLVLGWPTVLLSAIVHWLKNRAR